MQGIYKGKKYRVVKDSTSFWLVSREKEEGFEEYIDIVGERNPDIFVKNVDIHDLDYLYKMSYEIQYKGHFYILSDDVSNPKFFKNLGFTQSDKFYFDKKISRSDIEAIKIIEKPLGIFKDQGVKVKIIEGADIDDFLASVEE